MPKALKFDRATARQLRAEGMTFEAIAKRLGVTRAAIFLGLAETSAHQDWLRSLSPKALADYRIFVAKGFSPQEARSLVQEHLTQ